MSMPTTLHYLTSVFASHVKLFIGQKLISIKRCKLYYKLQYKLQYNLPYNNEEKVILELLGSIAAISWSHVSS